MYLLDDIISTMLEIVNRHKKLPRLQTIINELKNEFEFYELLEEKEGIYEFYDILKINEEKINDSFFTNKDVYIDRRI